MKTFKYLSEDKTPEYGEYPLVYYHNHPDYPDAILYRIGFYPGEEMLVKISNFNYIGIRGVGEMIVDILTEFFMMEITKEMYRNFELQLADKFGYLNVEILSITTNIDANEN